MADEWGMSTEYFPENVTDFFNETDMGNSTEVVTVAPLNFLDSFVKSLSVILVSEIGDKTFFLAGIKMCHYKVDHTLIRPFYFGRIFLSGMRYIKNCWKHRAKLGTS